MVELSDRIQGTGSTEPVRHTDQTSLYRAAIRWVREAQAIGRQQRISIASIHGLAEHEADRSSDLTRALRDAMLERVREGWSLHRIVSIATEAGLKRELVGLKLIDAIPDARVEMRAVIVDAMPVLAPLIVAGQVAFASSEDDRDFAALEGLEFHSPEMIDAMQQYFDLLWRDPRAIRLRTSAAGTLESAVSRVEAELRAFGKYQQHRRDRGLASGDPGAIETYLSAERRFEGEKELRNAIRSLHGSILWYEAHHSINSLDVLHDAVDKYNVRAIRIMSGDQNLQGNPKRTEDRFEKFAEEMAAIAEIGCEWRILKAEQTRSLHGRVILDDDVAITLPPLNSILKGTVDVIRHAGAGFDRTPYLHAWDSGEPIGAWRRRLQS
jgi:hypothetical protein